MSNAHNQSHKYNIYLYWGLALFLGHLVPVHHMKPRMLLDVVCTALEVPISHAQVPLEKIADQVPRCPGEVPWKLDPSRKYLDTVPNCTK